MDVIKNNTRKNKALFIILAVSREFIVHKDTKLSISK